MIAEATPQLLGPGIHPGLSDGEYDAIDAVRSSHLKALVPPSTPAHLRELITHPKSKKCFDIGNAAHYGILRPEQFDKCFAVAGQCAATTKAGTRCTNNGIWTLGDQWFCNVRGHAPDGAVCDDRTVITEDDYRKCVGMREAVWAHPRARDFLERAEREVTGVWTDPATELLCKFRMDAVIWAAGMAGDVKTARDASAEKFVYAIRDRCYHLSAAFYEHGATALDRLIDRFFFIAVESEPPHCVNLLLLRSEVIEEGWKLARHALETYAHCRLLNLWPGYPEAVQEIGLPAFEMRQLARNQSDGGY